MKIVSKRGKQADPPVEITVTDIEAIYERHGIIIVDAPGMSPEDIKRAEEVFKRLRRELDGSGSGC